MRLGVLASAPTRARRTCGFGNLVTMRWFEDTRPQESFADYLDYRFADYRPGFSGAPGHEIGRKPEA